MAIRAFLQKHTRIAIDTSIFIYSAERHPTYVDTSKEVFSWLELPTHSAVTSTITMTEVLVLPYRSSNMFLVNSYFALYSTFPNLEWVAPDLAIADVAAQLRANHRLKTPDALQMATALGGHATAFITNDRGFSKVAGIDVAVLDDFVIH